MGRNVRPGAADFLLSGVPREPMERTAPLDATSPPTVLRPREAHTPRDSAADTGARFESPLFPALWTPPPEFDGYRVSTLLGRGGMGRVFLAQDTVLERAVALKFVDVDRSDPGSHERFLVEARAIARLQHPNVVSVYRVGEVQGHPYIASEFVRGQSLDRLTLPLRSEEVLRVGVELARGLAAAHRRGVLHRDIKPANAVMSDGGEVKLLDFGLAKLVQADGPHVTEAESPVASLPLCGAHGETVYRPGRPERPVARLPAGDETQAPGLTRAGAFMGTPGYMAPDIWRGEAASFRSDVYSLGALLYHLAAGHPPHQGLTMDRLKQTVLAGHPAHLPALEPGLSGVLFRCLESRAEDRFASSEQVLQALESLLPERRRVPLPEGNPYRGLAAFNAEHRALFFGRETEVGTLLERLRGESFLLVAGSSGVGKSSLCRAGVLPRVCEGELDGQHWESALFTPGRHPEMSLAAALAPYLGEEEEALGRRITSGWRDVAAALRRRARNSAPLILFIDPLEELVTLSDPAEAAAVCELLEALAVPTPGLRVLATCRGDFIARVATLPGMGEGVTRGLYLLRPLRQEGVREATVGPARAKGFSFENDGMVEALVSSALRTDVALPLFQFALAELWETRDEGRRLVTAAALASLGGVEGALARHAEGVLARLLPAQREAARRILPQLVTTEGTRARHTGSELAADDEAGRSTLTELVRGRLLAASEALEGSAYQVAHEALIHAWPTLRAWLAEDAEGRAARERLQAAVQNWERLDRVPDALYGARPLAELRRLGVKGLPEREAAFVSASRLQLRRHARVRLILGAAAVGLLLAACVGFDVKAGLDLRRAAMQRVREGDALHARALAEREAWEVLRQEAFIHFDDHAPDAETRWEAALRAREALERRYQSVSRAYEAAFALKDSLATPGERMGDVLRERAELADDEGLGDVRDELLERLRLYDPDGSRAALFARTGTLVLAVLPNTARVVVSDAAGHVLQRASAAETLSLAAGVYTLELSAPGFAKARAPIQVLRHRAARAELSLVADVPEGFVFIPAGRFLEGSTDEGLRRDFFHAAPLHARETGAYLIAEHETTFGEWMTYVMTLPVNARPTRLPHVDAGGFQGALALQAHADGRWTLAITPAGVRLEAKSGEPLHYPERRHDALQRWERLPVVGVSYADAEAYVQWLATSGRVSGARLCTELEWERAARGADGRSFPNGAKLTGEDANLDETYAKAAGGMGPDEVGQHPRSRSPFGVEDLAGNVWEWTHATSASMHEVAVRGGSFAFGRNSARSENRELVERSFRDLTLGLRVCATP